MNFSTILFDLDGTLSDPAEGIVNALVYALEEMEVSHYDLKMLETFIGPPLVESFKNVFHFTDKETEEAIKHYRAYFSQKGIYENVLYAGMAEFLEGLTAEGKQLIIATSKPEIYAKEIAKYLEIEHFFSFIAGATLDSSRSKKADVIAYALEKCQIDVTKTVMIGDRSFDVLGAQANGLASIGVTYGYGNLEELKNSKADWIVNNLSELQELLLKK